MEELQSTEVLDREILEDARKKAARILRAADDQIERAEREWEERGAAAERELTRQFAGRFEAGRKEIMARLPLERRRARLDRVGELLQAAGRRWMEGLPRDRVLALLEAEFARRAGALSPPAGDGAEKLQVFFRHLGQAELSAMLRKYAGPWAARLSLEEETPPEGDFPAFAADSGSVRVSVSLEAVLEDLLDRRRGELAAALLGKEVQDA